MIVVISPHLDDAVLSCGRLLARHAGATVLTVFAGVPPDRFMRTDWDASSGFSNASEAIAARRAEDKAALAMLSAHAEWMDFCDSQYGPPPSEAALSESLLHSVCRLKANTVYFPLGLVHPDHLLCSDAALKTVSSNKVPPHWYAYEDSPYRGIDRSVQRRLSALAAAGFTLTPQHILVGALKLKRSALKKYPSQLRALASPGNPGYEDAFLPERFWRLDR